MLLFDSVAWVRIALHTLPWFWGGESPAWFWGFVVRWSRLSWCLMKSLCVDAFCPPPLCRHLAKKWNVMLFLGTCLLYCTRMTMPICVVSMAESFHWSKIDSGIVLGGFFWGYCFTQILGGHASDRWARRSPDPGSFTWWSSRVKSCCMFHQARRRTCALHVCCLLVGDHCCHPFPGLPGPPHSGPHDLHQVPDGVTAG